MTTRTQIPEENGMVWFLVRVFLPVVVLGAALLVLVRVAEGGDPSDTSTLAVRIVGGALVSVAVIAMVLALARRTRVEPERAYGMRPFGDAWRAFAVGAVLWLVPAALAFVVLALLGNPLTFDASFSRTLTVILLVLGAVLLSEAVPEEIVFRGYLMSVLGEKLHGWWIIVVQAVLFAGFGLVLRGWTGVEDLSLFLGMGIGLGYLRMVSGSVWTAVGFHTAFQTGSQLLLTHDIVDIDGSATANMFALGAIPFSVGAILITLVTPRYPHLFAHRQ